MKISRFARAPKAAALIAVLGSCHGGAAGGPPAAAPAPVDIASNGGAARGPMGALAMADAGPASVEPYVGLTTSDGAGLTLAEMTAHAVVDDPLSFTELHLVFENPEDRTLEGRFHIVLPPGAAISRLAMKIDGAWQEGEVVEKQWARAAYEDALHRRQDPALLEQAAANELSARVFPIRPRDRKEIVVSYSQETKGAPYTLPLRGLPAIGALHVDATRAGEAAPVQSLDLASAAPTADFVLEGRYARGGDGVRSGNMVIARARPVASPEPDPVKRAIVLFDTSASRALGMNEQARLLREVAHRMGGARLVVACFDQEVAPIFDGDASAFGDAEVRAIVERGPLGASDLSRALAWAGDKARASGGARVIVMSDGVATAGAPAGGASASADPVLQRARALRGMGVERIDAVAVGGIRDEAALQRLVTAGLARDGVVVDGARGAAEIARRVGETTRSRVSVSVPGATWVYPTQIDGVQSGDEVLVYAELGALPEGAAPRLQLGGAPPRELALRSVDRPLVERAVAGAKIAKLLDDEAKDGAAPRTRTEIVELSVTHRVLSPYTALVVLETEQDYARFGVGRRALSDVLGVANGRVVRKKHAMPRLEPKGLAAQSGAPSPRGDAPAARGNMWGGSIGDAFGAGGLGLSGVGEGGGGRGEGIGLGAPEPPPPTQASADRFTRGAGAAGQASRNAGDLSGAMQAAAGEAAIRTAPRPSPKPSSKSAAPGDPLAGGGGGGEGIGLGSIGTIGHGAGTTTASGFGSGHAAAPRPAPAAPSASAAGPSTPGASPDPWANAPSAPWGRDDAPSGGGRARSRQLEVRLPAPVLRAGAAQVSGRLPPEVIQRIVRQNFGRFRLCYENGLRTSPSLQGRVAVRFVIGRDGSVTRAEDGGSDLPDPRVVRCVTSAFTALSFPQPEGGVVTVVYPILFAPDGDANAASFRPTSAPAPSPPSEAPPEKGDPYTGRFKDVMSALEVEDTAGALQKAAAWRRESPGDVLALVALGEALEASGDARSAARAYGSIIDLFPGRADMRRFAGERLERVERLESKGGGEAARDLVVDTFEKAKADRPDHPSSHRLLAFARLRHGDPAGAFDALVAAIHQPYPPGRFRGVDRILREDLGLVAAAWIKSAPKRAADIERRAQAEGAAVEHGPSLRFVLDWQTDANDVDFHVFDATGGHAFYSQPRLPSGGELYADVTTGYGPECFAVRAAKADRDGPYVLQAHYFSRGPMGYGMGKLEIIDHDGAGGLTFEERPYVVMTDQAFVDLGEYPQP